MFFFAPIFCTSKYHLCLYVHHHAPRSSPTYIDLISRYNQTCIRQPLLGPFKTGPLGQVVVLENTFIKRPQTKSGRFCKVFSFYSHCECFINNKDLQFRMFWCYSWRLKMFLVTFYLRSSIKQVVSVNECKSCEIGNQMFFNVMFSFSKTDSFWT